NKDCQLNPTMPIYEKTAYHNPAIENIPNEAKGITQAVSEGAKVYGSGVFWWGNFVSVPRDTRDGQDYAKDRKWWLDDWVNLGSSSNQTITSFEALPSSVQAQSVANGAYPTLPKTLNAVVNGKAAAIGNITWASTPEYNSAAAGTYTFTAVLPGGYKLSSGAALPQIIVTVASAHKNSDSDSHKNSTGTSGESAGVETSATGETVVTPTMGEVPVITGNKSDISVTVPGSAASAVLAATAEKPAKLKINVPTAAIVDQMKNSAVQTVGLTIMAPASITNNTNPNASVAIRAEQAVLQAAKDTKKDITLAVANSETGKMAYSWTFKGADLAKSTAVKDIDLAISVCPTAEVSAVNKAVASSNIGLVLSFADNGVLPSNAIIKVNVADKNYKAGETVYFYYFNSKTQQLEAVGNTAYTVDQDGYVSVTISHCASPLLPEIRIGQPVFGRCRLTLLRFARLP
ncbi:MAG TPA: Ig-like domain-containing protein, partial [Caproiciproducens sp.]|nr:Ig-like domain-containing protein [Caproiciproducens sp.]